MERQIYRLIHFKEDTRIGDLTIWAHEVEERLSALHTHPAKISKIKWEKDPPQGKDLETYTDGSKMENKVGAAFVAFLNNEEIYKEQYRLNDEATVFQAEVLALKRALLWIDQRTENTHRIFTDSLSTLQSLNSIQQRSRSIISLKEMIHTIRDNKDLELNWIKAHVGNKGNERADEEAKKATQRSSIDITVPLSEQSAKSKILQETLRTWQER
ncbi:ribonuclease H-like [Stegodyphus dumicola]|uniref:ribonuclease H-like n=1 Tax=Stegodyphus dumicola TaxID=202533 RepID=UPI0015AADB49|nr:ribonuclease H-like [Stegodyphus dumicola]